MGPCRRKTTRSMSKSREAPYKKKIHDLKNEEASSMVVSSSISPTKSSDNSTDHKALECSDTLSNTGAICCTPKGERYRIPEITTCPPAPKKRRIVRSCSLQRTPIAFYSPPDLELFFFFALRNVPV